MLRFWLPWKPSLNYTVFEAGSTLSNKSKTVCSKMGFPDDSRKEGSLSCPRQSPRIGSVNRLPASLVTSWLRGSHHFGTLTARPCPLRRRTFVSGSNAGAAWQRKCGCSCQCCRSGRKSRKPSASSKLDNPHQSDERYFELFPGEGCGTWS